MRKIVAAVGLQPKDMNLADLDSVLAMFLSFQKGHRHRTIICVEQAEDCDWWVLDKIRELVEAERENAHGLTVLLSGQSGLKDLLMQRPLRSIAALAGKRISLLPFTLPETREYLRRRADADGLGSVDAAFDYHAIPLIHELCAGVPDAVGELYIQCRRQAAQEGVSVISKGLVKRAYELQRELTAQSYGEDETVSLTEVPARPGRLIVQLKGHEVREIALRRGNILIGRSQLCDIVVDSRIVSRHHALISYGPKGATIIDLGSTNGTTVDGYPVKEHLLSAGETIEVGDCTIEYIYDDALHGSLRDAEQLAELELSP
ncbi:MAG: FHA domain-containing protein [Burkholderiales bacterium]|nr:FHA domain-containing protein [Burkholderiales bacterium]